VFVSLVLLFFVQTALFIVGSVHDAFGWLSFFNLAPQV
jgi:hypothetical protein